MANKVGEIMSVMKNIANVGTAQYQKIGGKTVTLLEKDGFKTTRVRQGSKVATRTVNPRCNVDFLKIKNSETANVGNKRVHSKTEELYSYSGSLLDISKKQVDDIYKGDELIGRSVTNLKHNIYGNRKKIKKFYDKDANLIKTVEYDPVTGLRKCAWTESGYVRFDNKGLPTFLDCGGSPMDLGGLDKLV